MKKEQITDTHSCAFCDSIQMSKVIDFGKVALAGGFLMPEEFDQELKFPLRLYYCHDCYAMQVVDKVPEDGLVHNYFYFSSSIVTLSDHFQKYASGITSRFLVNKEAIVLEFGCNDGV